jgi:Sugar-transfer associated ATP-grasp
MRVAAEETSEILAGAIRLPIGEINAKRRAEASLRGGPDDGPTGPANAAAVDGRDKLSQVRDGHAVTRDKVERDRIKPTVFDYLRHAQKRSGRRALEMTREFLRLNRGCGRLTWPKYVQYGVYDKARYSPGDQAKFLTNTLHWPITRVCCDMTWQATTEDKWLCAHILARSTIRVPETLAVIDKSERAYPATHKISTAEQLRDFMTSQDVLPAFGKENRGICSFGAFQTVDADHNAMLLKGQGWLSYDACMEQFVGTTPYLLQPLQRNHSFFDRYTDSLATVRVCILISEGGIKIPFAILKLPSRENVADSFWRHGNLACNLDLQSGRILTVRSKDSFGTTDHTVHPDTGLPLLGEIVPMWDRVLDLAHRCAPIFQPVRYQSMDIGITQTGPVLIEINTGGGFDLPQLASGEGFLTDEVCDFFRACGYSKL